MAKKEFTRIESTANVLDTYQERETSKVPASFGICSKCVNFFYRKTKYGTELYYCEHHFDQRVAVPNSSDPVAFCSNFSAKGQISLELMWNMATLVNVNTKTIGFDLSEREVTFSKVNDEDLEHIY